MAVGNIRCPYFSHNALSYVKSYTPYVIKCNVLNKNSKIFGTFQGAEVPDGELLREEHCDVVKDVL